MFSRSMQVFTAAAVVAVVLLSLVPPSEQSHMRCQTDADCHDDVMHCASGSCACNTGWLQEESEIAPGAWMLVCKKGGSGGLSGGAIAGIVIGVLILVVAAGVGVMYMRRQRMACFA